MTSPSRPDSIEVAHVLFFDIVGYTLFPIEEQTRLFETLRAILRATEAFRAAEASGEMLRPLVLGDGIALVFFHDPITPLRLAVEVSLVLRDHSDLRVRTGIHSGPIQRVEDINAAPNVTGGGINFAQRTMDCGDAGHILLSSAAADFLRQLDDWAPHLHDLGEHEVKHGATLHLFNYHDGEAGNPDLPEQLKGQPRIVVLYRRNCRPDGDVLDLLDRRLTEEGFEVFIDRHMKVGQEWAREIERRIRTADAVTPLLSAASVTSEMLEAEVQIAVEAARVNRGRPRILPVRVAYSGPLPDPIGAYLNPMHYAFWEGPDDDEPLVDRLVQSLRGPAILDAADRAARMPRTVSGAAPSDADESGRDTAPDVPSVRAAPTPSSSPSASTGSWESVGGAVPLHSPYYVVRPTDEAFCQALLRRDSIVLVKGARQIGKTSLLARGLQRAREGGARVAQVDLQTLNSAHLASAEALYLALAESLADQLDLEVWPDEAWNARRGPNVNFERYLRREVIEKDDSPLVWGLDEVDRLFTCDFGSEVFGLFRSWHNKRSLDPAGPWSRLTLAIAYATEAHLFITDVNQSPFNVGTRLGLEDFTRDQVGDLNLRHGSPLRDEGELSRFHHLLGGHPYLVRRALLEMAQRGMGVVELEDQAIRDDGIFGDHLHRILILLARDADLTRVVKEMLKGRPCLSPEAFHRLRSAGLFAGDSAQNAYPRCPLYAAFLERHLA